MPFTRAKKQVAMKLPPVRSAIKPLMPSSRAIFGWCRVYLDPSEAGDAAHQYDTH